MAFPVIASENTTTGTDSSGGVALNMPSGITAGDLLYIFVANDSNVSLSADTGWTMIRQWNFGTEIRLGVFAKIAAGSDTFTYTADTNDFAAIALRITGHGLGGSLAGIERSGTATGTSSSPDCPSLTPTTTTDWLFLAAFAADDDDIIDPDTSYSSWPTSYSAGRALRSATGTSSCTICYAQRSLNTGSAENPSAFALTASEQWIAELYAIPGATSEITSVNTISQANITSINGISAANIDTLNGITF